MLSSASPMPGSTRASRSRSGMTLVELIVSMVLLGLIGGLTIGFLLRQQRFYAGANEILLTRTQVRQAASMLPSDLRGISSSGKDIYVMTDTSIEFRSTFGSSYVCASTVGKTGLISIPPKTLARKSLLTTWSQDPVAGDSVALYVDSTSTAVRDDSWSTHQITAWATATTNASPGCLSATGMMLSTDVTSGNPSYSITIAPIQSKTVAPGAAVRFFKRVHYSLYRAADGLWYLGYYDCRTGRVPVCNPIQPVAGPFRAYDSSNPQNSGVRFAYYDSTGAVTTTKAAVSRISILLQGEGAKDIQLAGGPTTFRDSLRIEVGLRNWK
jgi:prepilin-type N-terminal cleavage/methylation domain-containing protein